MKSLFLLLALALLLFFSNMAPAYGASTIEEEDEDSSDNSIHTDEEDGSFGYDGNPFDMQYIEDDNKYIVFDEVCSLLGVCYVNTAKGKQECIEDCSTKECYECKGLASTSICCLSF